MSHFDTAAMDICRNVDFPASLFHLEEPDCPILFLNPALESLLGVHSNELAGTNWSHLWESALGEEKVFGVIDSMRMRKFARSTGWGKHADGNRFYSLMFFEVINVPNQSNIGMGCHFDLSSARVIGKGPRGVSPRRAPQAAGTDESDPFFTKVEVQRNAYQMRAAGLAMAIRNGVMLVRMSEGNAVRAL